MQLRARLFSRDDAGHLAIKHSMSGVVERAKHSRDIPQRRIFDATFANRAPWITFKIDEDDILASEENLTEMEISVDARSNSWNPAITQRFQKRTHLLFTC